MSSIAIETKRFSDLTTVDSVTNDYKVLIHDGTGVKTSPIGLLHGSADGDGAHNSVYRGKNLGETVTDEQWAAIADGSFRDMYIGDYWVFNGTNKLYIAAFDYYYGTGVYDSSSIGLNTHHIVILPETIAPGTVVTQPMISSSGTYSNVVYKDSVTRSQIQNIPNPFIINVFGGSTHVLTRKLMMASAVSSGVVSAFNWFDSTVDLMTEANVFGQSVYDMKNEIDKSQFPIFALNRSMINYIYNGVRYNYWFRSISGTSTYSECAYGCINSTTSSASYASGLRATFCIKA